MNMRALSVFPRLLAASLFLSALVQGTFAATVENPDFETGDMTGWDAQEQGLVIGISTNTTFNRNYSARISGEHSGEEWVTNTISQTIPVRPGDALNALGFAYWKSWVTTDGGADGYLEARLHGADGISASQVWTEPHDGWVFFEFSERTFGLANSGFEEAIAPWEQSDGDLSVLLSRSTKYSGDSALCFRGSWTASVENVNGWGWNEVSQGLTLESGTVLRARGWINVKTLEVTGSSEEAWMVAGLKLEELDEEKDPETLYSAEAVVDADAYDTGWEQLEFLAVIPCDGFFAFRIMICGNSMDGTNNVEVYFDDVWIERDPPVKLENGDFETGDTTGWGTATDQLAVEVTDEEVYEGDYSLCIEGSFSGWSFDRAVQEVYLKQGDVVTVNGRVYVDTLSINGGWSVAIVMLENMDGGPKYEWKFESGQHGDKGQWLNVDMTNTIAQAGMYEFVCGVLGDVSGAPASAKVFFDDMQLAREGDPEESGETGDMDITLSLSYVGTAGGAGGTNTVDVYFDTAAIRGSSAQADEVDDMHAALVDAARAITEVGGSIPPVKYPGLFTYGYPGGDTNVVNYPAHVEVGVASWRFKYLTNDVTLVVTNTIDLYGLGGSGPGYIEFDQYMYAGRSWALERGATPDIETNAPYWVLGEKDGTSEGFGDGPFPFEHTFVVGVDNLTNFPRRIVTDYDHYGQQWPRKLHIVFEENMGEYDREYDKYFVLSGVITNGSDTGVKAGKIELATSDPGNTNFFFTTFELHMGWASEEESHGIVDYPNVTYQGHNEVFLRKGYLYGILDREGWYAQPVARGSATIEPITLYARENRNWNLLPYEEYLYVWPNAGSGVRSIYDDDQTDRIPGQASYHVGFKIGHQYGTNEFGEAQFPNVIEIRGNGYFRMTDYEGVMGGSLRPIAADIFGLHTYKEDSPIMPEAYVSLVARTTPPEEASDGFMRVFLPVRSKTNEWYTGVVKVDAFFAPDQVADEGVYLEMETDVFANKPVVLEEHGPLNLFAQVNMYWRGSQNVNQEFEGHDHDTIIIKKADGEWVTYNTLNPPTNIYRQTLSSLRNGDKVYIMQQDRGPESYGFATEAPYRRVSHFEFAILDDGGRDLVLDVFEQNTISEINDNIVIACAVNESLEQGEHVHTVIRYRSFFAPGVIMAGPNTPDGGEGWGDNTYTIEFYATDGEDKPLRANIYYGNGTDGDWPLINEGGMLLVPEETHKISYDWDVSGVPPGAYYIKAEAQRLDGGKKGFAVSRSRLQVGPAYGLPNNGSTEVTITTNQFGYVGTNMSFETGNILGWASGADDLDIHASSVRAYHGTYSARMEGDWSGWSWNNLVQDFSPSVPGETLTVQGRVYIGSLTKAGSDWVRCGIKMENADDNTDWAGVEFDAESGVGAWIHVNFERTTSADGADDRLLLWVAGNDCSAADVFFDAITVTSTNIGLVVTNEIRRGYWEGDASVDVTGYDMLGFHVAMAEGGEDLLVWVEDDDGITNALPVINYVNPIIDAAQRVLIPWTDFDFGGIDLEQVRVIGFTAPEGLEPEVTAMRAGPNPVWASVEFIAPPMSNSFRGDLPHYNPWEDVIQVVTLVNQSGAALTNIAMQLLQEYGETAWWWDESPHVAPRWSERSRKGDRLGGTFEAVWDDVTIPDGATLVVTNVYKMPVGRLIDHTLFAIPSSEDWFAGRNYDGLAQVRLVVRNSAGDNLYENDQIASYSMDDDNDLDNDGLPDWWERLYSGSPVGMNPDDDPDDDTFSNMEEFLAGSDPTCPISTPLTVSNYVLRLAYTNGVDEFPRAAAEQPHYTGVASAWMIARYLHGSSFTQSQDQIYAANTSDPNHNNEITPQSCASWMYGNAPIGYYFSARYRDTLEDALRETVYWMDYTPPGGLKSPVYILCGTNWSYKVVRGLHTDRAPYDSGVAVMPDNEFEIYGLWLNDPAQGGIGYNVYATASELESIYRPSLASGRRWLVAEPPKEADAYEQAMMEMESAQIRLAEPEPDAGLASNLKKMFSDADETKDDTEGQYTLFGFGLLEEPLPELDLYEALPGVLKTDSGFMDIFDRVHTNRFYLVNPHLEEQRQYVLAAGGMAGSGSTLYVLKLGMDGAFHQATWEDDPVSYLPLFWEAAEWLICQDVGGSAPTPNRLKNESFEDTSGGVEPCDANHWTRGDGAGAFSWGGRSGDWLMGFASWIAASGYVYQDYTTGSPLENEPFTFAVWMQKDALFEADSIELKLEWYSDTAGNNKVGETGASVTEQVDDTYRLFRVDGVAPENTLMVRATIWCGGMTHDAGALKCDDAMLMNAENVVLVEDARLVFDPDMHRSAFLPEWEVTLNTATGTVVGTIDQERHQELREQDSDGNGVSDLHELYAGTDPMDPSSALYGSGHPVVGTPGQVQVVWDSVHGRTYSVWRSTNSLSRSAFMRVGSGIPATPPVNEYTDTLPTERGFYRIEVE